MSKSGSIELTMDRTEMVSIVDSLPADTRDRITLIDMLTAPHRAAPCGFDVYDDGVFVTIEVLLDADHDELHETILQIAGDVRCFSRDGKPLLQARFLRDSRRDPADSRIGPMDAWPAGTGAIAVDFHDTTCCTAQRFAALLAMAKDVRGLGRTVYFLHTPPHLRLYAEVCGGTHLLPIKREMVGPRLPDVLSEPRRYELDSGKPVESQTTRVPEI